MRIYEIAPGEKRSIQIQKFDAIWDNLIVTNCNEIIEIYSKSNSFLYRGIKGSKNLIFRGYSRIDRFPSDSYRSLSDLFDIGLKKCGMTALRSNSLFTANSVELSSQFGNEYIIFPIDGFEYTYTTSNDLVLNNRYDFLTKWANEKLSEDINLIWVFDPKADHTCKNWAYEFINRYYSLDDTVKNINELLTNKNYPLIKPEDLIDFDKFKSTFNPQNSNLIGIIDNSEKEIMIKGTYYAFNADMFRVRISKKLGMLYENK